MQSRPLIGITVGPPDDGSPYVQTRSSYVRAVEAAGGLPVLIPPVGADALDTLLARLDGIVFPGGADVDPAEYGEARQPRTEVVSELDRLELAAARWAVHSEVPTLGICRGQQVLNVALGGSLIQHLDDHRQPGDRTALTQKLRITPGSRLADVFGATEIEVNTMHHQAVNHVATGLEAVAWSEDGTIEGIESHAHPWLLMVQFHPEELVGFHVPSQRLFSAFVDACRARMSPVTPRARRAY
ncbi:MAG TPA: gamma-glutamyl-gamma-aminobutyrate hydrolase family protein [Chloroflexota bacterium]|nr:gamma-glutamyl-gamma-aminobutyrate hydrolase family protein [Chloroflexota bacterium]